MASIKVSKSFIPDDTFEDSIKRKQKKSKKEKKQKQKEKKTKKERQWLKDVTDCCELFTSTQIPDIKKRNKKKKKKATPTDEYLLQLTQHEKTSLSKRHKKSKSSGPAVCKFVVQLDEQEPMRATVDESSTQKKQVRRKKRVVFKLSPEEILPKSQLPSALRDTFQTQLSHSVDKQPSLNTALVGDSSHSKPSAEENVLESQSTSEDINSQDLFITQKSFLEPCVDISSSPSTDDTAAVPSYQNSKQCRTSSQEKPSCKQSAKASTQTENFFTSPVFATTLRFLHRSTAATCTEEPLDLSLPNRSRQAVGLHGWNGKPVEDQNRPELKTTDITSSDESDILSKGKADLSQLKVVQTRLNESFFFKVKGEGDSPKPRSPLMVLTGSMDKKSKNMVQ